MTFSEAATATGNPKREQHMTDTTATETAAPTLDTSTDATSTDAEQKPSETVDFWKAKAREQEKRAKANADAADRLAKLEESQKTEAQRLADAAAAAQQEATEARAEALRFRIATKFGISDEDAETFLNGTDEETLMKQAERLAAISKAPDQSTAPGPRPDLSQGARSGNGSQSDDPAKSFANFLGNQLNKR